MVQWTPDTVKTLTALHANGLTPTDIANQLGCSKNSVAGKLFRLDLVEKGKTPAMVCAERNQKELKRLIPTIKSYMLGEDPDDINHIGIWITRQRFHYRRGSLSEMRIAELEAIPGWSWERKGRIKADAERAKAIAQQQSKYIPEYPCLHGHRERYTKSGGCVECTKQSIMRFRGKRDANKIPKHKASPVSDELHQARAQGYVRYQTSYPCKHGHTERYARNGICVQCQITKTRRWQKDVNLRSKSDGAEHQIQS